MDYLRAEILSLITSCLLLHDKLKYIVVCKHWNRVITQRTLYESWKFSSSKNNAATKFHQALDYFKHKPFMGQHVRHLEIGQLDTMNTEGTIIHITRLFPNITSMKWLE